MNQQIKIAEGGSANVTTDELVRLCAVDNGLFTKTFFPKTARQEPAPFHADIWNDLENPSHRFLNLVCYRDSAKTSLLRMFTGKRVAFYTSRTILYVSSSESHAVRSIQWLRSRIEEKLNNDGQKTSELLAQVFALRPGKKWTDTELEIIHGIESQPIWILGVGITGNIRGINFDDYRPDLIILDDILTDENGATKDQRDKITDLVTGALKNSLAPASEAPNAKLVMLNTPQAADDVVDRAAKDSEWHTVRYSCWTKETENLALDKQVSSWEARHPTLVRRAEKLSAIKANRLSSFVKEKEVKIVTRENAIFLPEWLQFYDEPPAYGQTVIFIDPTPPPDKKMTDKRISRLDYEVVGAMRRAKGNFYLLDYEAIQGTNPDWTLVKFFEMLHKWRPYKAIVEGVAYQKTLKWILENEMKRRQRWITIESFDDIRSKPVRIQTLLHGPASNGRLFVKAEHVDFISQFTTYPSCENDDIIDGVAMGIAGLTSAFVDLGEGDYHEIDNSNVPKIKMIRSCP